MRWDTKTSDQMGPAATRALDQQKRMSKDVTATGMTRCTTKSRLAVRLCWAGRSSARGGGGSDAVPSVDNGQLETQMSRGMPRSTTTSKREGVKIVVEDLGVS